MLTRWNFDGPHVWENRRILPQDAQKGRPARPQRVKGGGGTYQASLEPLASITCERIVTLPLVGLIGTLRV